MTDRPKPREQFTEQDLRDARVSVRMFTEPEVTEMLLGAGVATPELAREHVKAYAKTTGTSLRAHGASSVEGATLVEIDEGLEVLVPRDVADAIYRVAEHFRVPPKLFMRELRQAEQAQHIARELREDR